ncbi:chemotaxis protein CheW [Merismopedia glauca]|uniref:Chemotaxis protein CheW n=1 Tax=Merismopedia glauca CCAP 1448/3 TaxID=1296344 RepID=A0A2T1C4C5_9CYAN|nr:chemotaxis protein CheW [Merismopedia glauca]PSB02973.1 chemotaxis protein CheW [Merismopedia glauca CCAP 1448/3]
MTIYSPLRYRRFTASQTETIHQLIGFRLRQEWFALPINTIQKIIPLGKVYGDPKGTGISLTNYEGQEVLVIDVGYQIFGDILSVDLDQTEPRFLVIIASTNGKLIGLPIDSPPSVLRVPESSLTVLPETYLERGNIKCISSTMIQMSDRPPLFLLDPNLLKCLNYSN